MRSRPRLNSIARITFAAVIFFLAALSCVRAQALPSLPKSWNEAVNQLAAKIASTVSPSAPVEFNFENNSSLDAVSAGAVESALRSALESHSFHLVSPGAIAAKAPVLVTFTLSESAANYVWVVRVSSDPAGADSISPAIVSVAKLDSFGARSGSEYVSLEKSLIWKQPRQFLDFALLPHSSSAASALVVLDTSHFAVYEMSGSELQVSHTSPIPQNALLTRDPSGEIETRTNSFRIAGRDCTGDPDLAGTIHCRPTKTPESLLVRNKIVGLPNSVGSFVFATCDGQNVFLGSGDGDWTQSDAIQAYLTAGTFASLASNSTATPSGSSLPFPGPVLSLYAEPDANSARAVVHNLKTGDYEAYIVTATCSH